MFFTKKNFGIPPPGYVAGVGRGAVGFTTRSDIGPANDFNASTTTTNETPNPTDLASYDESQFDKFAGYKQSLFSSSTYDNDDLTADKVYQAIDDRMDSRRKKRREKLQRKIQNITLDVYHLFKDDKAQLSKLSLEDWASLPEAGRHTKRPKKSVREKFTPVPDLIIHSAHEQTQQNIDCTGTITPMVSPTPFGTPGTMTPVNLTQLGHAREKVLDMALGKLSDSVDGQTVVDPKGYLTDLKSKMFSSDSDVSDLQKARLLFKSITGTNPKSAPGWIGAARLEEYGGKQVIARKIILRGCDECPESEDVWIEAARLHDRKKARAIIARAVTFIPKSVKLWLRAERLEQSKEAKRAVLRKALHLLPTSLQIWKVAIELEDSSDARILLSKAVKCLPKSLELWLALARLENYEEAKKVLNEARQHLSSEPRVWIAAAKLEEAHGSKEVAKEIIPKGLRSLRKHGVIIDRDFWLREAYECERTVSPVTCRAIVSAVLGEGIDDIDRKATWRADALQAIKIDCVETARAIYKELLSHFREKSSIWWDAVMLEKEKGSYESLCNLLEEALKHCPGDEKLWLLLSKEKWLKGEKEAAQKLLEKAMKALPNSETVYLAAVRLEFEGCRFDSAKDILSNARDIINTPRIWMKSAIFEREFKNFETERDLLQEATKRFKRYPKLWLMLAQSFERSGDISSARSIYQTALKHCSSFVPLWLCFAQLETKEGLPAKARSVLETAKLQHPRSVPLWLASVRLEAPLDSKVAERLLAKGLQTCPTSGELWAYAIENEIQPKRRGRCHDALKALSEDAHVFLMAAKLFWFERKRDKAKNWFERALKQNGDLGDIWANYLAFLKNGNGSEEEQNELVKRCIEREPKHGEMWVEVSKGENALSKKTEEILLEVAAKIKI